MCARYVKAIIQYACCLFLYDSILLLIINNQMLQLVPYWTLVVSQNNVYGYSQF